MQIIKRNKALSVNPLKSSSSIGAALAILGFYQSLPMLHGSQGCTAFGKVFFVQHFREPIPLQTTAMDQVSTVMGSDESIIDGLTTICEKNKPALIGIPSTGLSETQGCDLSLAVREFRRLHPEYAHVAVVPVATPDYQGCLETGFARALEAVIDHLVPVADDAQTQPGKRRRQVNVLVGASFTPGDIDMVKSLVEAFGLRPQVLPDIGDSLDGHLPNCDYSALSVGGCAVSELAFLGDATATLAIGPSIYHAADRLHLRTGVPQFKFQSLMGLSACDQFVSTLADISGIAVPKKIERQRAQLQDAMLDSHFLLGQTRVAIGADADLLLALETLLLQSGAEPNVLVTPTLAPGLKYLQSESVKIGDLEDLQHLAKGQSAELIISNSHARATARALAMPLLRAGFPQHDTLGGFQKNWVGYQGSKQALFDIANLLHGQDRGEIKPYLSILSQKQSPRARAS